MKISQQEDDKRCNTLFTPEIIQGDNHVSQAFYSNSKSTRQDSRLNSKLVEATQSFQKQCSRATEVPVESHTRSLISTKEYRDRGLTAQELASITRAYATSAACGQGAKFLDYINCTHEEMKAYIDLCTEETKPCLPEDDPVFLLLNQDYTKEQREQMRALPLADLRAIVCGLHIKMLNKLSKIGIETLGDLETANPADLLRTRHFGQTAFDQCYSVLKKAGLIDDTSSWHQENLAQSGLSSTHTRKKKSLKRRK